MARVNPLLFCLLTSMLISFAPQAKAEEPVPSRWAEVAEGFDMQGYGLLWATQQRPVSSTQNPDNAFATLPEHLLTAEMRPDFFWAYRVLDFSLKPRAQFEWQQIGQGPDEGQRSSETDLWVNEWRARIQLREDLLASYGRESLQWGPSFLTSPSNPFFDDNGRLRLNAEVRGRDFARLLWVIDDAWSLSAIANTGKGAGEDRDGFEPIYALKLDWAGDAAYASLIGSHESEFGNRLGGFAGCTASDALLLYTEAVVQQGSKGLYPTASSSAFGLELIDRRADSSQLETQALIGGSYTLTSGGTVTLEYLYNSAGYDSGDAKSYYDVRQQAADAFRTPGPDRALGAQTLSQTIAPQLSFLRRHYLMVQYVHPDVLDRIDLTGRWTINLEDRSTRLYGSVVYSMGDHLELFTTALVNTSHDRTEFGSLFRYQWTLGLTYAF